MSDVEVVAGVLIRLPGWDEVAAGAVAELIVSALTEEGYLE
jgi:hypothetical protein